MGSMGLTQGRCFPVLPRYSRRLISVFSAFRLRWDLKEKKGSGVGNHRTRREGICGA